MTAAVTAPLKDGATAGPAPGRFAAVVRHRAGRKLLAFTAAAFVLVPLGIVLGGGGSWPAGLTVDVSGPLDDANLWVIDNRDTHPLFLYFLLHLSNTATDAVGAVYNGLNALGWPGFAALAVLFAWRAAGLGRRGAKTAGTAAVMSPSAGCSACGTPPCSPSR